MKQFLLLVFLSLSLSTYSQSINPRIEHKNGITLSVAGPSGYGSLSYNKFLSPTWNLEVGGEPVTGFVGIKYHFGGELDKSWTPYVGAYGVYAWLFDVFDDDDLGSAFGSYIPVGINYLGINGFSFAFEGAMFYIDSDILAFGSLKFGYHF